MKLPNPDLPTNPTQAMFDAISAGWQSARAATQLTLGGLIKQLETFAVERKIKGLGDPISYRGYYDDLAFETSDTEISIAEALKMARGCMGKVFEGYKSGEFLMGERTPVWSADYGSCGSRIMGLNAEGEPVKLILAPDSEE